MKILTINSANNGSSPASFNGMWSKVIDKKNSGLKYLYYPFKNEAKENLNAVTSGKNFIKSAISIMAELPFTAKEYALYLKNRLPITRDRRINNTVVNKNLSAIA